MQPVLGGVLFKQVTDIVYSEQIVNYGNIFNVRLMAIFLSSNCSITVPHQTVQLSLYTRTYITRVICNLFYPNDKQNMPYLKSDSDFRPEAAIADRAVVSNSTYSDLRSENDSISSQKMISDQKSSR